MASDTEMSVERLAELVEKVASTHRDQAATVEVIDGRQVVLREGSWELRVHLSDEAWVVEEASEIAAAFGGDLPDQAVLAGCRRRVEIESCPEEETDDHYNSWLLVAEHLAQLDGVFVFSPVDGTFFPGFR